VSNTLHDLKKLEAITDEIEGRQVRKQKISTLDYEPTYEADRHPLVYPGTVTAFISRKGAAVLAQIRAAVKASEPQRHVLAERLYAAYGGRTPVTVDETVRQVTSADVIAEIRYGGATLVRPFIVPDELDVAVLVLPYTGGRLAAEGFTLAEFVKPDSTGALEAVIVVDRPKLTEVEQAALDLASDDQAEMSLGRVKPEATPFILGVMLVVEFAVTYVACKAKGDSAAYNERALPADVISEISPAATARELMALRRKALARIQ
jgi:hypothetical protein